MFTSWSELDIHCTSTTELTLFHIHTVNTSGGLCYCTGLTIFKITISTFSLLWFILTVRSRSLLLWWTLVLTLLRLLPGEVRWSLSSFIFQGCLAPHLCLHCLTLSLLGWTRGTVAFVAQIPHVHQSLLQTLDQVGRTGLRALTETGHAEDNVVRLRIVARSISVGNHRSVAAEHLHGRWDLEWRRTHSGILVFICNMGFGCKL